VTHTDSFTIEEALLDRNLKAARAPYSTERSGIKRIRASR